jgi:ATP-dependent Lhr-like helicase
MEGNAFDLLEPELKKLVGRRFSEPTPIQAAVIPLALGGKNLLTISETGSGKTEACLLPIFNMWLREKPGPISILYITPMKSLNRDLLKRILWWSRQLDFDVSVRHGDTSQYERKMQSENPPDMMISTPETLQAILTGKIMREHLRNVRYVVIDEVHELVPGKRGLQLTVGLERLKYLIRESGGPEPQLITLSATVGSPGRIVDFFSLDRPGGHEIVNVIRTKKTDIRVESPRPTRKDIEYSSRMFAGPGIVARLRRIQELVRQKKSVLAFTNTREFAEILSSRMKALDAGLPVETHHSSLSRDIRISAEKGFRDGAIKALICTSSLELGIDIGLIDFVIQYQSPRQVAKFLQRIGRSGHNLDRISDGVIISGDDDDCFESAVIAKHALEGSIEPTVTYGRAWDVLAHQIVGLAMDEYNIPADKAFSIVKMAFPYRDLKREEFMEACLLMQKLGYMWVGSRFDDGTPLRRRSRAFEYYYRNLSTIPDVRNYRIHDIVSDRPVGTLDAEFIAMHGSPGTSFICKGQAWRIIDIERDRVHVEPAAGIEASIPAWEGELIPVPYEVAQGIGRLRGEVAGRIGAGEKKADTMEYVTGEYPVAKEVADRIYRTVLGQSRWGPVPDDGRVVIEHSPDEDGAWVVIHSCWGSLVNDTIGRVLSSLLMNRLGSVGLQTDPCRIMLRLQDAQDWKDAVDTFMNISPEGIGPLLRLSMPNSELFTWRFIHVCQRFGIISRDADYGRGYIRKIAEAYSKTLPYREAISEIEQEKLDIERSAEVIGRMRSGMIKTVVVPGLSPLSRMALKRRFELMAPDRPEKEILRVFGKRLMDTKVGIVCTQCGWATINTVQDVREPVHCPLCYAGMIAVVPHRHIIDAQNLVRKLRSGKQLSGEEERWHGLMMDSASLVVASGKNAILVLAGRGIGPRTAGRVLSRMKEGDELIGDILDAERNYAKTRRFWKD